MERACCQCGPCEDPWHPPGCAAGGVPGRSLGLSSRRRAPVDTGRIWALDAETIQHLHSTLRALPRPLLESLTRAFRKRFQVPEAAASIADRINQKCHHDWIETFLVSLREVRPADQHQASSD
jgi:hypothetical protein